MFTASLTKGVHRVRAPRLQYIKLIMLRFSQLPQQWISLKLCKEPPAAELHIRHMNSDQSAEGDHKTRHFILLKDSHLSSMEEKRVVVKFISILLQNHAGPERAFGEDALSLRTVQKKAKLFRETALSQLLIRSCDRPITATSKDHIARPSVQ